MFEKTVTHEGLQFRVKYFYDPMHLQPIDFMEVKVVGARGETAGPDLVTYFDGHPILSSINDLLLKEHTCQMTVQ